MKKQLISIFLHKVSASEARLIKEEIAYLNSKFTCHKNPIVPADEITNVKHFIEIIKGNGYDFFSFFLS